MPCNTCLPEIFRAGKNAPGNITTFPAFRPHGRQDSVSGQYQERTVLWIVLGLSVVIGAFSVNVRLDNDIVGLFKKDSSVVQRISEMSQELPGAQYLFIRIEVGTRDYSKTRKTWPRSL